MDDYRTTLSGAVKRTEKWGLRSCSSLCMEGYLRLPEGQAPEANVPALADLSRRLPIPPPMRAGACVQVHMAALTTLYQEDLAIPPVLTIGNVLVDGKPRYQVSRQGIRQMLRAGPKATGTLHVHTWLTWSDLTIFDLTLRPAMLAEAGEDLDLGRPDGLAVIGKSQELKPELSYVPYLVGTEFAWRIGALLEGVEEHFRYTEDAWLRRLGQRVREMQGVG